jgi:hypothetical protein
VVQLSRSPTIDTERRRLDDNEEARGREGSFSPVAAIAIGSGFLVAGAALVLIGTRVLAPVSQTNAPLWILTALGASLVFMSLTIVNLAWRQHAADERRQAAAAARPDVQALADYEWDPTGFTVPRWHGVVRFITGAAFFTLFLSIFNYWAFVAGGPWLVKMVTGAFDALTLVIWGQTIVRIGRALKFHGSRVTFDRFPYRPGATAVLHWRGAQGVRLARRGSFTLRCVQESIERRGTGSNQSVWVVRDQVWAETLGFDTAQDIAPDEDVMLSFDVPADALTTTLSDRERAVCWELVVTLDLRGFDFAETYLVPIYK